jgi:hypothetical protein
MKTASNFGRSLHLVVLVLCGLTFDALLLGLLLLLGSLVIKQVHAQAPHENATSTSTGNLDAAAFAHEPNTQWRESLDFAGVSLDDQAGAAPGRSVPTSALRTGRSNQTATLLQNGKVLVAGGESINAPLDSAELYDPTTGTWSLTGGEGRSPSTAELYDPVTGGEARRIDVPSPGTRPF